MISAFRRTLCGAGVRCSRIAGKNSTLMDAALVAPIHFQLARFFADSNNRVKVEASEGGNELSGIKKGIKSKADNTESVSLEDNQQDIIEASSERPKTTRTVENLGEIDEVLPELRNFEKCDILRNLDFKSRVAPILQRLTELGVSKAAQTAMASRFPLVLATRDASVPGSQDVLTLEVFLRSEYGLSDAQDFKMLIIRHPSVVGKLVPDMQLTLSSRAKRFGLEKTHVNLLLAKKPRFLLTDSAHRQVLASILVDTLKLSSAEVTSFILQRGTLYMDTPAQNLQTLYLELFRHGFNDTEIKSMFDRLPTLFTLSGGNFRETWRYLSAYLHEYLLKDVYFQNPILMSVDFAYFLIPKLREVERFGYSKQQVIEMFLKFPVAFARSLDSLRTKLKYLERRGRMEIKTDVAFPGILSYQYARFIRARGEIMLKADDKQKRLSWSQVMQLSDEQFCEYYNVSIEQLRKLQTSLAQSAELDTPYPTFLEDSSPLLPAEIAIAAAQKQITLERVPSRFTSKAKRERASKKEPKLETPEAAKSTGSA